METNSTDPCSYCGCMRKYHNPDKSYTSSKFRIGLIGTYRAITARTCCDKCPHCICSCVAFVEPFEGQPRTHCYHATENNLDHDYHTELDSPFDYTISRMVPPVQSGIPVNTGVARTTQNGSNIHQTVSKPRKSSKVQKLKNLAKPKSGKSGGLF